MLTAYTHKIVSNFMTQFPLAYKSMQQTNHNEPDMLSKWHLEGSIWTHTMMVVASMANTAKGLFRAKELLVAALLHDVGKVYTREISHEKQKVTFYGHPGFSTCLASDMLPLIDPELTESQRQYILTLISHHQVLFNVKEGMSEKTLNKLTSKFEQEDGVFLFADLETLRLADSSGRIAATDGTLDNHMHKQVEDILMKFVKNFMESPESPTKTDPNQPKAVIMVGLPGSGKSTYIKKHLKDYALISRDAQVERLAPEGMSYSEAFKTVDQEQVDKCYQTAFANASQKKQNLVVDKTNLTHKSRMKSINTLRDKGYAIEIIVLMPLLLDVYRRNQQRVGKVIPQEVIRNMMKTFEIPFPAEGDIKVLFDF